jgi:hypothetical protein
MYTKNSQYTIFCINSRVKIAQYFFEVFTVVFIQVLIRKNRFNMASSWSLYRSGHAHLGLFQEKIPSRVETPLIFFYLGGGRKTYFFSGGCGRQFGLKIMQKKRNRRTNNRILYTV